LNLGRTGSRAPIPLPKGATGTPVCFFFILLLPGFLFLYFAPGPSLPPTYLTLPDLLALFLPLSSPSPSSSPS
jgi:hypothetical protein